MDVPHNGAFTKSNAVFFLINITTTIEENYPSMKGKANSFKLKAMRTAR